MRPSPSVLRNSPSSFLMPTIRYKQSVTLWGRLTLSFPKCSQLFFSKFASLFQLSCAGHYHVGIFQVELHPQRSHPPSAPLVSIHAPLSKNKLPKPLGLQPGGVGGEEGVYGPEERGPPTRSHPRARSRAFNSSHMGAGKTGWAWGWQALLALPCRTLVSRLLPPPAASQSKMPGPRVVSTASTYKSTQHSNTRIQPLLVRGTFPRAMEAPWTIVDPIPSA